MRRMIVGIIGMSVCLVSWAEAWASQCSIDLQNYISQQVAARLLEPIVFNACRSGCPRYGYNRNMAEVPPILPGFNPRLGIHEIWASPGSYLKRLRNAAYSCPNDTIKVPFAGGPVTMTVANLLWSQGEMLMLSGQARFYDASQNVRTLRDVMTSRNTIDVTKFDTLTWVTEGHPTGDGSLTNLSHKAHAMTQADIGSFFFANAWNFGLKGDLGSASYYLRLTRAVFETFANPDAVGGVRNNKTGYRCFNNRYCYWFHSRSISSCNWPETTLNQHLHAVRDALRTYVDLDAWRANHLNGGTNRTIPAQLPPEFLTDPQLAPFIDRLREFARGGLFQLAYANGPTVDPTEPPSLWDFAERFSYVKPRDPTIYTRYYAHYKYFFDGAKPAYGHSECKGGACINGGRDIANYNTCHYHHHNLDLLAEILGTVESSPQLMSDPDWVGVYYKLLYGRDAGNTYDCHSGPPSSRVMDGVPLAEYYRTTLIGPMSHFMGSCIDADHPPNAWLGAKYANCVFNTP